MRKRSAHLFLRSLHSTDRLLPAVVRERDDQMSGPRGGAGDASADGDGERPPIARVRRPTTSAPLAGSARETVRPSCPVGHGRWSAAKARQIIPATNACVTPSTRPQVTWKTAQNAVFPNGHSPHHSSRTTKCDTITRGS